MTQTTSQTPRDGESTDIQSIADKLWQAADKLRGMVDAAEYKHAVLGLLFLKYISDSFESRRAKLKEELAADGITGEHLEKLLGVFRIPPEARWQNLQNQARVPRSRSPLTMPSSPSSDVAQGGKTA